MRCALFGRVTNLFDSFVDSTLGGAWVCRCLCREGVTPCFLVCSLKSLCTTAKTIDGLKFN